MMYNIIEEVEPKIVFTLEEEIEAPIFEIHEPVATIDLVPTKVFCIFSSEYIVCPIKLNT